MKTDKTSKEKAGQSADVIELLLTDHKKVKKLFKEYEKIDEGDNDRKLEVVATICHELQLDSQLEEELFYPAVRDAIDEEELVDEAVVEHGAASQLIAELLEMDPDDDLYDAKVTVLSEEIEHHIEEEEKEIFPKVKKAKMDIAELGRQVQERKQEIASNDETRLA